MQGFCPLDIRLLAALGTAAEQHDKSLTCMNSLS